MHSHIYLRRSSGTLSCSAAPARSYASTAGARNSISGDGQGGSSRSSLLSCVPSTNYNYIVLFKHIVSRGTKT